MGKSEALQVSFSAVGDVMLGGQVGTAITRHGAKHIFEHVAPMLKESDIVFGNLEAPFTTESQKSIWDYSKLGDGAVYLKAMPDSVKGLTYAGFNIVSLANNHIMDYGSRGLFDTIDILSEHNISYVGVGKNIEEARRPAIIEANGLRVGFLAYCEVYTATKQKPGCAAVNPAIYKQIKELENAVDVVIVSLHQGMSIADYPLQSDIKLCHSVIDSGANLVLRHHPHVLQGVEYYKNGLIVYSLGNFVFDYNIDPLWAGMEEARESMILQCGLHKSGIKDVNIVPVFINNNYQSEIPTGENRRRILTRIDQLSAKLTDKDILAEMDRRYIETVVPDLFRTLVDISTQRRFSSILSIFRRFRIYHARLLIEYLFRKVGESLKLNRSIRK